MTRNRFRTENSNNPEDARLIRVTNMNTKRFLRMMYYSRKWHRHTRKKEIRVLLSGVEPKTFRLLVRMLYP